MNRKFLKIVFALVVFSGGAAYAAVGQSSGYILTRTTSARAFALADSFGSVDDDISAMEFNPGALATISKAQMSVMYNKGFAEDDYRNIKFGFRRGGSVIGCSVDYYDAGTLEFYDPAGTLKKVSAEKDIIPSVSYAHAVRIGGESVYTGLTLKYFSSTLVNYKTATAYVGDAGILYSFYKIPLMLGVSARNFGSKVKYDSEGDPFPASASASGCLHLARNLFVVSDVDYFLYDKIRTVSVGGEWMIKKVLALRGGYKFDSGIEQVSFGFGLKLNNFTINYAYRPNKTFNYDQMLSLDFYFSRPKRKQI